MDVLDSFDIGAGGRISKDLIVERSFYAADW